jgi:excisionase family DNA binding protein
MVHLSLREAADACCVSKSTILRAIKSGRISAPRTDDGGYAIDPAELHRVYPPRNAANLGRNGSAGQDAPSAATHATADGTPALQAAIEGLKAQLALMREQLDDVKGQRDGWQKQAESAQRMLIDARARRGLFGFLKAG